jgi:hypothetical protein
MSYQLIYFLTVAGGMASGFSFYARSRKVLNASWKLKPALESLGWGAALAAGLHLLLCAAAPEHLVHLVDAKTGAHVHLESASFEMDMLHRIHIAIGGVGTVLLAYFPLRDACRDTSTDGTL